MQFHLPNLRLLFCDFLLCAFSSPNLRNLFAIFISVRDIHSRAQRKWNLLLSSGLNLRIKSKRERPQQRDLQSDVKIQHGRAGGPLLAPAISVMLGLCSLLCLYDDVETPFNLQFCWFPSIV